MTDTATQTTDFNYVEFAQMLRDAGQTEAQIETHVKRMHAAEAQQATIERMGLKVHTRKHLLRVSNVTFRGGRLHDGTCHYQHQTTIAGNTYNRRASLKAAGYRWDATDKLWAKAMTPPGSIADHLTEARSMVAGWAADWHREPQPPTHR